MQRRDFLGAMAGVAAGSSLAYPAGISTSLRLGLNSYCLRSLRWTDQQILEYAASLKLDAVFLQDSQDPRIGDLQHWREMGALARQLNLHVETGVGAVLPREPGQFAAMREQLLLGVERAKAIGSPLVRCLHASDYAHLPPGGFAEHRDHMARLLRSVRQEVSDAGLKIAIENHKDFQAWQLREIIEAAGSDFVGSYLDTGNPVFVAEDPATTVETLAPYALTFHLRDSVVFEQSGGAMVQWVPLGQGQIDFRPLVAHVAALKPQIYVYVKPITGRPPELVPYLRDEWWHHFPAARAAELAQFLALARRGTPYDRPMVVEDLPGVKAPEAFLPAIRYQQRQHMEVSVQYAKDTLKLGKRWRS